MSIIYQDERVRAVHADVNARGMSLLNASSVNKGTAMKMILSR